jgi:hypothetical protein
MRIVLWVSANANLEIWMTNNKTEAALRIAEASESIAPPSYFTEAIEFISGGN